MHRQYRNDDDFDFDDAPISFDESEQLEQRKIYKRSARQQIDDRLEQRRIRDEFGISESDFAKLYH